MKIRHDFVTNSSSSSFVIVGVKLLDSDKDSFNWEDIEEAGLNLISTDYYNLVGDYIAHWEYGFQEIELSKITNIDYSDMRKRLEKLGLEDRDIKIFTGTEYC